MVQRCKFSIELKNFPPDLSGEPELVQSLVEETGLPKNVVRTVVNALPTVVAKGIREGESISMKGFGSFVPWQQSERLARNPKTGEEVMITPRVSVKFKAGSDLLKELNE